MAFEVLMHPNGHAGQRYFLTGGEAVGFAEVATVLSEVTGRTITYQPISMEEARRKAEDRGTPPDQVEALLAIYAYQKGGGPTSVVSDKVSQILGRPPRTIRDFFRDHAERF